MIVKFVGGPYKGRVEEFPEPGWNDRIRISAPPKQEEMLRMWDNPTGVMRFRQGEYVRSHVRTGEKVHYVWLGWIPDGI